jgi:nucleotide-binding universal stress UspA family protein
VKAIVCAVDRSSGGSDAVATASELSRALGLRLVLAHVVPDRRWSDNGAEDLAQEQRDAELLLERIAAEFAVDAPAATRVEIGDRASELARIADEETAAVVVVGSRLQGRYSRRLLSSLATQLNRTAPCPVLVAPPRTADQARATVER